MCDDPDVDKHWFNEVQKSFNKVHRQGNVNMRFKEELDIRRMAEKHRVNEILKHIA